MKVNPYSPPRTAPSDFGAASRKRWVAAVLALIAPPIAMLYLARPLRAAGYFAATIGNLLLALFIGSKGIDS